MAHGDTIKDDEPPKPLKIDQLHRDILVPQLDVFIAAAPDSAARGPYEALRAALDTLEVPPELAARLGAIAELAITSGRVRNAYGPGAELALWSLFQKTPRGREIASNAYRLGLANEKPRRGAPGLECGGIGRRSRRQRADTPEPDHS